MNNRLTRRLLPGVLLCVLPCSQVLTFAQQAGTNAVPGPVPKNLKILAADACHRGAIHPVSLSNKNYDPAAERR